MAKRNAAARNALKPQSAANGKAKKIHIVTGAGSRKVWRVPLDGRSVEARLEREQVEELTGHLGGELELTAPMRGIVQSAARAAALEALAWSDVVRRGAMVGAEANPAADLLLRAMRAKNAALQTIGLSRRTKRVPSLSELIDSGRQGELLDEPGSEEPKE